MNWFSNNKPGSPVPVIVEVEVGGTDYRFTDFDEKELYGWPGDQYQMKSVTVKVKADTDESEYLCPVLASLHLSTPAEMAWAPKVSTEAVSGLVITVWHSRSTSRKLTLDSGELPIIAVGEEGVRVGAHLIDWNEGDWDDDWDRGDDVSVYLQGTKAHGPHALRIHKWREALGPVSGKLPARIDLALYMVMHELPEERQLCILGLLQELDYLIHHGDTSPIAPSPEQFIIAMTREPERILNLAFTLPWERACRIFGPASLKLWLEENHPQSPRRKPPTRTTKDPAESEEKAEWPPNNMRIFFAMRAAQMAGTFSQADADRMDEGPPETWPLEIWQKLGFAPPSPATVQEQTLEPSDEISCDLSPGDPISAEVNIRASGEVYRITRDTTSDPCDGEEILLYNSVKVEIVSKPENGADSPVILESSNFRPEDEDFPLVRTLPDLPHIGQVEETGFYSVLKTEIRLRGTTRPNVRITKSGVTVGEQHLPWDTIHERGSLDQYSTTVGFYHGVALSREMKDLIFNTRSPSSVPRRTIIRHLANEIDFIAAHTQVDGFDGSPAGLVELMNDDPEAIMRAVLAMPWDFARRICGPAEVAEWIEENHPESPKTRIPIQMKKKSVIETDPAKVRQICLNQPRISQEEMVASILAQNGKLPPSKPEKSCQDFPAAPPIV